jgi:dihydrofolate synthase/folylpolyglutamate synthase
VRSLDQWLAYQTQLHPQAIDMGLERLQRVLANMRWHQPTVPVITVAGTNGKGSVTAYCTAILQAAGYRVGTFTSPHLRDYRERIRIHDRLVDADALVEVFERIEAARGDIHLTFFEFNALAAFLLFQDARLDAWVLEIGMGGRLDAVNVIDPDAAVVVSIGLDHQEYLGDTLEAIAHEKAGIFRAGRAAIIGGAQAQAVLEREAHAIGAVVKRFGRDYDCTVRGARWDYRGPEWHFVDLPAPALLGDIQFENAATALAALESIELGIGIDLRAVTRGLRDVRLPARFEVFAPAVAGEPTYILDVAHNPDAARTLASNLQTRRTAGRTLAVCGILADKDAAAIAGILDASFDAWWCASIDGLRGQSGTDLANIVRAHVGTPVTTCGDVAQACAAARAAALPNDCIVIFGSFHTVGPALDWLESGGISVS